ncbi:disease resistance protein SUMM2-like [Zingiber officinale]|uniref:disease resistance protein SUMM2-like n=1 Tax=Zingiber officinale TaxID=94328 RepID=UPI001C4B0109|nr:disease resistance protein SUMM2-like [Zingiber officinale]
MATFDFGKLLDRIWDAASIYLARPRSRVVDLHRDAELLKAKLVDFNGAIDEAVRNGKTVTKETQLWKRRAETFVSEEVDDAIQRDYRAMRCLGGWSWNCVSINRIVTKKLKEVKELISQVDVSRVTVTQLLLPPASVELPISKNVVGMQSNLIQIVNQIRDENASVIGIYGMGGIGKTTLLKLIHNHEEISKLKFQHVVWIVASKGCKLQKLQTDLAKKVRLNLEDDESEDDRASKLCNFLKEKNCLLFLDDIWESYELYKLGMEQVPAENGKEQKRKVVVSRRAASKYALK